MMTESRIFDLTNPEDGAGAPYSDFKKRREHPQRQDCALRLAEACKIHPHKRATPVQENPSLLHTKATKWLHDLSDALVLLLSTRLQLVPAEMTEDLRVWRRQQIKMSATGEQLQGGLSRKSRSEARSGGREALEDLSTVVEENPG